MPDSAFPPIDAAAGWLPWLRPGAVVHQDESGADRLLVDFAACLRRRGFRVAGCLIDPQAAGCPGSWRLSAPGRGDEWLSPAEAEAGLANAAAACLAKGAAAGADLLVVSRLDACRQVWATLAAGVDHGGTRGGGTRGALLTAVCGGAVADWQDFCGPAGAMIAADRADLWRWWGPEHLYRDLAQGVAEDEVRQIVLGPRWVMVEGPRGAGLACLPRSGQDLSLRLAELDHLSLRALAEFSRSWDGAEAALGLAAVNAHYNCSDDDDDTSIGTGIAALTRSGQTVTVIGAFPGMAEMLPDRVVVDPMPRPGEFPLAALDTLLPGARAVVVASATLVERQLARILRLARGARVALTGPATPLSARLHDYGVEILGGLVVKDRAGLARAVRLGLPPRGFGRFGQYRHIRRAAPAHTLWPEQREWS